MKSLFTLFAFALVFTTATAQQKKAEKSSPSKYIITESKRNEVDQTEFDLDREGFFMFMELDEPGTLHMINSSAVYDAFSYGPISKIEHTETEETEELFASDNFDFKWHYSNTYDDNTGYATVNLKKVYKPQGIVFYLTMILPNLDILEYTGFIKGSVNFANLK
jgi:hypothetical protein